MKCPRCEGELSAREYEGVEIDTCKACGGSWLDEGELGRITGTQEEEFPPELIREVLAQAFTGVPRDERRTSERCPRCQVVMVAVNFDYSSGVVIDRCPDDHGVWLDGEELERVQVHREEWTRRADEHGDEWLELARSVNERQVQVADETRKRGMRPTRYLVNSVIRKFIGG